MGGSIDVLFFERFIGCRSFFFFLCVWGGGVAQVTFDALKMWQTIQTYVCLKTFKATNVAFCDLSHWLV